jgi:hypothetical protein
MASDEKYRRAIRDALDATFERAEERSFDPARERIAVFSDHHRGAGDTADDFRRCEHAYTSALGYYRQAGYRLFVLGDVEELWEERAETVISRYRDVLALEAEFARDGGGVERFYGNHDDQWASAGQVRKHLGEDVTVREALRLRVERPGRTPATLFFVHGHQGTDAADRWGFARLAVRHLWRPLQRRFGFSATTPARSYALRARHDQAMFEWARKRPPGLVLIAGHTHRPVFARSTPDPPPTRPIAELEEALRRAVAAGDAAAAAAVRAELEYARTSLRRPDTALRVSPPCYFNTGCCSFPDGDVTGLEIADGELRLVRWPGNLHEIAEPGSSLKLDQRIRAREELERIFHAVTEGRPPDASAEETEIRAK